MTLSFLASLRMESSDSPCGTQTSLDEHGGWGAWWGSLRNRDRCLLYTHHPADGATDGVGLKLTVEAPGYLVDLQEEEQRVGKGRTSGAWEETWSTEQHFHLNMIVFLMLLL